MKKAEEYIKPYFEDPDDYAGKGPVMIQFEHIEEMINQARKDALDEVAAAADASGKDPYFKTYSIVVKDSILKLKDEIQ